MQKEKNDNVCLFSKKLLCKSKMPLSCDLLHTTKFQYRQSKTKQYRKHVLTFILHVYLFQIYVYLRACVYLCIVCPKNQKYTKQDKQKSITAYEDEVSKKRKKHKTITVMIHDEIQ